MALIKCKECGHEVSDKAPACPNCGCPIEKEHVCNECGALISSEDEFCPNCGNPMITQKGLNLKKPIFAIIIILLISGGAYGIWQLIESDGDNKKNKEIEVVDTLTDVETSCIRQIELTPELTLAVQKYDEIHAFHDGLALVVKDGKYGYINERGEEVIPCQRKAFIYRDGEIDETILPDFSEGRAVCYTFTKDESNYSGADYESFRYGYINKKGEVVIPIHFKNASSFNEGVALVSDDNGKQMFIDKNGEMVAQINSDYDCEDVIYDGLALVWQRSGSHLYGFVDKTSKVVIPIKYSEARSFSEGMAYVKTDSFEGFIDTKGNEILPCKGFYAVGDFHEGLVSVIKEIETNDDGRYFVEYKLGFMDKKGKIVIPITLPCIEYEGGEPIVEMEYFSDGLYEVADENRFIDKSGKTVLNFDSRWWIYIGEKFSQGLVVVNYGDETGFMDKDGKVTISDSQIKREDVRRAKEKEEWERYNEEQHRMAIQNANWLQGVWVGEYNGTEFQMIINGNKLIQIVGGQTFYNGDFLYDGDDIYYNKTSNGGWNDVWPVDEHRQVLLLNDLPMRHQNSNVANNGNSSYPTQNATNQNSTYRFVNPESVIDYLSRKTFSNGVSRIRITSQGVFINGNCMTGAPQVVRYSATEAYITARVVGMNIPMKLLVDPIENKITDLSDGDVYNSR